MKHEDAKNEDHDWWTTVIFMLHVSRVHSS